MKKLTAIIPDTVDPAILAGLLAIATEFRLDALEGVSTNVRSSPRRIAGRSVLSTIMEHYTPDGVFSAASAKSWVMEHGYKADGIGAAISRLAKNGYIRHLGSGRYQFKQPLEDGKLAV